MIFFFIDQNEKSAYWHEIKINIDGSVVTWGCRSLGGDSSSVSRKLRGGVTKVFSSGTGFAALKKKDGSVVTWGIGSDEISVDTKLALEKDVERISSTKTWSPAWSAFVARKKDGSLATWGQATKENECHALMMTMSFSKRALITCMLALWYKRLV